MEIQPRYYKTEYIYSSYKKYLHVVYDIIRMLQ